MSGTGFFKVVNNIRILGVETEVDEFMAIFILRIARNSFISISNRTTRKKMIHMLHYRCRPSVAAVLSERPRSRSLRLSLQTRPATLIVEGVTLKGTHLTTYSQNLTEIKQEGPRLATGRLTDGERGRATSLTRHCSGTLAGL